MSFFIKGKQEKQNKSGWKNNRKRKLEKPKLKEDEIISSDSDEDLVAENGHDVDVSEEEHETPQEKKLRLAKVYLEEIEKEERRRLENKEEFEDHADVVANRLKEDYLRQVGKLKSTVACKYTGADLKGIKTLKCKEHKNCITTLCVSHDNKFIYSGSKCGAIVKWSLSDFKKVGSIPFFKHHAVQISKEVKGHSRRIMCVAISTDNKFLAVSDESKDIQIWNPETLKHINTLTHHRNSVTGLAFRRDTHTLYSCSKDKSVKVWSLDEMAYVETMYGHQNGITSIDALTRERAITSGGQDSTIRVWKIAEESQLIYNGNGSIDTVKLINEENFISGGDDGQLNIWSCLKKKPLCSVKEAHGCDPINKLPNWITAVSSLQNTDLVASGSYNGEIKLWKLGEGFRTIDFLFSIPVVGFVNALMFSSDGAHLIAGLGREHRFGRWNVVKSAKTQIVVIPLLKNG